MKHKGPEDTDLTSVDGSVECLVNQSGQPRSLDQANEIAERTDLEHTGSSSHTRSLPACLVSKKFRPYADMNQLTTSQKNRKIHLNPKESPYFFFFLFFLSCLTSIWL